MTGGCQCGRIRYAATVTDDEAYLCHCRMCQRSTGAPVVSWLTMRNKGFAWTRGEPVAYRSSPEAERLFCPTCGTQMVFRALAEPDLLDVTLASLDDPLAVRPDHHSWTSSRIAWFETRDDLPRHPEHDPSVTD